MHRSRAVVVVCHCLLNANSKVRPLAAYPGAALAVIEPYLRRGYGIFQLPCPELCHLGGDRWGMTREQYDCRPYRRRLDDLAATAVDQLAALARDGCRIEAVVGMDGSPSCGVFATCLGFTGGEPGPGGVDMAAATQARVIHGSGLFIDALRRELAAAGLAPPFWAVDETAPSAIRDQPTTGYGGAS